jgi:hypothetical protein
MEVPPYGSVLVSFALHVRVAGQFRDSVPLYLDDGTLREVKLSVSGDAVEPSS